MFPIEYTVFCKNDYNVYDKIHPNNTGQFKTVFSVSMGMNTFLIIRPFENRDKYLQKNQRDQIIDCQISAVVT